ncbi:MAG: NAD-dependent epimerase/dehydratase family protein, partial [Leptospira sp.]|nr:NAD-dependent epimerase/dehydratase family protein [Leptospira sp.]
NECVRRKIRFVYASSAATYGVGENGYDDASPLQKLVPLNMYGYSKHMFDLYAEKKGLLDKIAGLKYFNVFGFGEAHKGDMKSLVLKGYDEISSKGFLSLFKSYKSEFSDGEQKRDFLYVLDAAKITIHILFGKHNGIFNVGRGVAESWNELAKSLFSAMEIPQEINYIEMPEHLKNKYQYFTKAETKRLLKTGYKEGFTSLQDAVTGYVQALRSQS